MTTKLNDQLEIKRLYKTTKEVLFDALTQPDIMAKWFYGMDSGSAHVESDLKVGGKYVINMKHPDGSPNDCGDYMPHGEYLEIDPPNKLSFTWISEGFVDHSVVTIWLEERDDQVELTLRHELPQETKEPHVEGWTNCLQHLEKNVFPN